MPELPEVETIKNSLAPKVCGKEFAAVKVRLPKVITSPSPEEFAARLKGKRVKELARRGKYLLFHLSDSLTLLCHLRLSGRLIYTPFPSPPEKHTHVTFFFRDGARLHFSDLRQFGELCLVPTESLPSFPPLAKLGPEPLAPSFDLESFARLLEGKKRSLKPLLLDQRFLAGIGNIYADEILFAAGLSPWRSAATLAPEEVARLYACLREVLQAAIAHRGTSVRDYVDGEGKIGGYQEMLRVYGREREPCVRCRSPIARRVQGGRSTYFCTQCQR